MNLTKKTMTKLLVEIWTVKTINNSEGVSRWEMEDKVLAKWKENHGKKKKLGWTISTHMGFT